MKHFKRRKNLLKLSQRIASIKTEEKELLNLDVGKFIGIRYEGKNNFRYDN